MTKAQIQLISDQIKLMTTDEIWQLAMLLTKDNKVASQWLKADLNVVEFGVAD